MVAQVAGCFVGAALVYADYFRAIDASNAAHNVASDAATGGLTTFSIFATFPASYLGTHMDLALLDQVIGTFFLLLFILAISDNLNLSPQSNMGPFMVGIAVAAIGMSYGVDAGYAINPARDFGPRLFTWVAGWGPERLPRSSRLLVGADRRSHYRCRPRGLCLQMGDRPHTDRTQLALEIPAFAAAAGWHWLQSRTTSGSARPREAG